VEVRQTLTWRFFATKMVYVTMKPIWETTIDPDPMLRWHLIKIKALYNYWIGVKKGGCTSKTSRNDKLSFDQKQERIQWDESNECEHNYREQKATVEETKEISQNANEIWGSETYAFPRNSMPSPTNDLSNYHQGPLQKHINSVLWVHAKVPINSSWREGACQIPGCPQRGLL